MILGNWSDLEEYSILLQDTTPDETAGLYTNVQTQNIKFVTDHIVTYLEKSVTCVTETSVEIEDTQIQKLNLSLQNEQTNETVIDLYEN